MIWAVFLQARGDPAEIEITSIETDNRRCIAGSLFVCIKGYVTDGHRYAAAAVASGAAAVLAQSREALAEYGFDWEHSKAAVIFCPDTRWALSGVSATFYGDPSQKLRLVGVTGTKGKTSTTYMLRAIYQAAGLETGLVGTICNKIGEEEIPSERTTPEANILQELLFRMLERKIGTCIMEVSSQGLHLERVGHCHFGTAVFTNLSKDHIGENEHANMEEYAEAKSKLFTMCENALINRDSAYAGKMLEKAERSGAKIYTFGIVPSAIFMQKILLQNKMEWNMMLLLAGGSIVSSCRFQDVLAFIILLRRSQPPILREFHRSRQLQDCERYSCRGKQKMFRREEIFLC